MSNTLFMGDIPLGKLFFLRLENAFLLAQCEEVIEIVSDYEYLEKDLISWCAYRGERFLQKLPLKHCYSYTLKKQSHNRFDRLQQNEILPIAPEIMGLSAGGSVGESASPQYHFALNHKDEIWSENIQKLYEDSKNAQWNASVEIDWNAIPQYNPHLEFALAQIMTYLVENEFSALYIPAQFIPQIAPYYTEVPLLLSSIIGDEARHIEVFIKRAKATGLGLQYSTRTTQQSLWTLFREQNYFVSSFLLHVMGEGTFVDLLHFLEDFIMDAPTKKLLSLARKDEMRHVSYGMQHIKQGISLHPQKIQVLKEAVLKRKNYLDELSGESTLLLESLAVVAGGGGEPYEIKRGFEALEQLKIKMEKNRTKRLVECGIDEELARDLSKAHTPNFM